MISNKALAKFEEFHQKEPNKIVELRSMIPQVVFSIGHCAQISYRSNKWMPNNQWKDYIHWWEHNTLVCVPSRLKNLVIDGHKSQRFDLGKSKEVTFLGYALDFAMTSIDVTSIAENERLENSREFKFRSTPGRSKDYVCCDPSGRSVYVISDSRGEVFVFKNLSCVVTSHGIEG